jgi:hypothetical protein
LWLKRAEKRSKGKLNVDQYGGWSKEPKCDFKGEDQKGLPGDAGGLLQRVRKEI